MNLYFTKPADLAPVTKARSVDFNNLNAAIDSAFRAIPTTSQVWTGLHDFSGAIVRVPMPLVDSDAASKAYVDALAFKAVALPGQPGGTITYNLTSLGGVPAWQPAKAIFDDLNRLAQAQATALSF